MNIYNVRKPNITVESTLNLLRVCFSLFVIVVILNIFCACFHPSVTGSSSSRSVRRLFSACCLSKSLFHILQRNLQSKAPNKFGIFVFFVFSFPFCFVFFFLLYLQYVYTSYWLLVLFSLLKIFMVDKFGFYCSSVACSSSDNNHTWMSYVCKSFHLKINRRWATANGYIDFGRRAEHYRPFALHLDVALTPTSSRFYRFSLSNRL